MGEKTRVATAHLMQRAVGRCGAIAPNAVRKFPLQTCPRPRTSRMAAAASSSSSEVSLTIKCVGAECCQLRVALDLSVRDLKQAVAAQMAVPVERQRLILELGEMQDLLSEVMEREKEDAVAGLVAGLRPLLDIVQNEAQKMLQAMPQSSGLEAIRRAAQQMRGRLEQPGT